MTSTSLATKIPRLSMVCLRDGVKAFLVTLHMSLEKINKSNRDYYDYYLPIDCLPKHSLTYLTPADVKSAESSLVSFEENDIIFGAMRPYFHKVCFAQSRGLTRTTCFVLNSKERIIENSS